MRSRLYVGIGVILVVVGVILAVTFSGGKSASHVSAPIPPVTKSQCTLQTQTWWGHGGMGIVSDISSTIQKGAQDATSGNLSAVQHDGSQLTGVANRGMQDMPPRCADPHGDWSAAMTQFALAGTSAQRGNLNQASTALQGANADLQAFSKEAGGMFG